MLVACFFFKKAEGFKPGLAIFIPSTGVKDKPVEPEQIRNPDGLISSAGFDRVRIQNGKTVFSGKNTMTITFSGGEVYHAELQVEGGRTDSGTCVVKVEKGVTEAMNDFDGFHESMNEQEKDGSKQ
jgi:hypothetical protein